MPWTKDNPPPCAKNWTDAEKGKCVAAANAVLSESGDEQKAIFACIHAAGRSQVSKEDAMKTMTMHEAGMQHAMSLVKAGQIDHTSSWSFASADKKKAMAEGNKAFLASVGGMDPSMEGAWAFPVEKGGKVYAHGVHAAESYATKNGHSDIAAAAKKLASAIQDKKNGVKRIPSSSLVKEDADQGIVGGVVLTPYLADKDGDWFPPSEIEGFSHSFMENSRAVFGPGHLQKEDAAPVASWVVPFPTPADRAKAMAVKVVKSDDGTAKVAFEQFDVFEDDYGTGTVKSGEWVLENHVADPVLRAKLKKGDVPGDMGLEAYSVNTEGFRTDVGNFNPADLIGRVIRRSGETVTVIPQPTE